MYRAYAPVVAEANCIPAKKNFRVGLPTASHAPLLAF